MPTVTFLGERGRPEVSQLDILGMVLQRNEAVSFTAQQLDALRAHPQFGQFWLAIRDDPPAQVIGAEQIVVESETGWADPFLALPGVGVEVAADLHQRGFATLDNLRWASDEVLLLVPHIGKRTLRAIRKQLNQEE